MAIRVTVWGENVHDRENETVRSIYPKGMHGAIAEALNEDAGIKASTATLDQPEHGLSETRLARDRRADLVGPQGPWRGGRRDRRAGRQAGLAGHGPDRPPLGPLLEDLQEAHGHALLAAMARGGREGAGLGDQPQPPDRARASVPISWSSRPKCMASPSRCPSRWRRSSSAGTTAARSSARALTFQRGGGRIFYFSPGHEVYPIYNDANVRLVLRNAVKWAYNPAPAWTDIAVARNSPIDKAPEKITETGPRLHKAGEAGLR